LVKSKIKHTFDGKTVEIVKDYLYDHAGRLTSVSQKNGTDPVTTLATLHYNEIGQLIQKKLHVSGNNALQTVNYYPFGAIVESTTYSNSTDNKYRYNGKELQKELELQWSDHGARMLNFTMSRWTTPDPLAEKYYSLSPYAYVANNPMNFIDPDGREIWIYYEDEDGNEQKMPYTANMQYKGNDFVSTTVNFLNAAYNNGGAKMMDVLIGSSNSFNMVNQIPTYNGSPVDALQFDPTTGGGGNIYAKLLLNSNISDFAKVEGVAHELFHGFQHEKGQGGASVFNEVEASVFGYSVAQNWGFQNVFSGARSGTSFGTDTPNGQIFEKAFFNMVNGNKFSSRDFIDAVNTFQTGSAKGTSRFYQNHPLRSPNQTRLLLPQFYPLIK